MEININCDLGEKSKFHSTENDPALLNIVNSANIACGYHAGDEETMNQVVDISKKNGVSIGAHPSFNDPDNFGRKRMNLSEDDGNLVSRSKPNALITDPEEAKVHVLKMVKNQALNCHTGKQIPCEIDSVCIHGDNLSSLATAKSIKENLIANELILKPLNKMKKFS